MRVERVSSSAYLGDWVETHVFDTGEVHLVAHEDPQTTVELHLTNGERKALRRSLRKLDDLYVDQAEVDRVSKARERPAEPCPITSEYLAWRCDLLAGHDGVCDMSSHTPHGKPLPPA